MYIHTYNPQPIDQDSIPRTQYDDTCLRRPVRYSVLTITMYDSVTVLRSMFVQISKRMNVQSNVNNAEAEKKSLS